MTSIECPECGEPFPDTNTIENGDNDGCSACAASLTALKQGRDYRVERWTQWTEQADEYLPDEQHNS